MEEDLCNDTHPHVFWATLHLPIPPKPTNLTDKVYDMLKLFLMMMMEADPKFIVFPYHLSKYKQVSAMPSAIMEPEKLPVDLDEWLEYFLQAKPHMSVGDTYTSVLVGMIFPLLKVMKVQSQWFKEKWYGFWKSALQLEQLTAIGWLLFSTNTMDMAMLQEAIAKHIQGIPVGLCWCTISLGTQGSIPQNQQVKALHVYMDILDAPAAKPLPTNVYDSKVTPDHAYPLHVWMRIVLEMDTILNTKGQKNANKICVCQATQLALKTTIIKTWEIELLDNFHPILLSSLQDAMMQICHLTNKKFMLFHSVNKFWRDSCYILMVLKFAESFAHTMIAGLLPYLIWHFQQSHGDKAVSVVNK